MFIIAYTKDNSFHFEGPAMSEYEEAITRYNFLCHQLDFSRDSKSKTFGVSTDTLITRINRDKLDYLSLFKFGSTEENALEDIIDSYRR